MGVNMDVIPFQLGVLPSTLKETSAGDSVPPGGEADPCAPCEQAKPCFNEACVFRDTSTGIWSGLAAPCNEGAQFCELCFPGSACLGIGKGDASIPDEGQEDDAAVPSDISSGDDGAVDSDTESSGNDSSNEDGKSSGSSINQQQSIIGMLVLVGFLQF